MIWNEMKMFRKKINDCRFTVILNKKLFSFIFCVILLIFSNWSISKGDGPDSKKVLSSKKVLPSKKVPPSKKDKSIAQESKIGKSIDKPITDKNNHPLDPKGVEFFETKIRPILVESCYSCHSEVAEKKNKLKGGLLLDSKEGMQKGGDTGKSVIDLSNPNNSLLLKSLRHEDELKMPPKGKLSAKVIKDFSDWIAMGAPDPRLQKSGEIGKRSENKNKKGIDLTTAKEFWAFQLPKKIDPPKIGDLNQAIGNSANTGAIGTDRLNAIDAFILAKIKEKKLQIAGPADRATLIRRVYFDLIGLPPTPEEVNEFVHNKNPNAYAELIDRLLAKPQYGERWARMWLDVARYAEDQAHTFAVKPKTNAFQYRDWVIQAMNRDMPYTEFIRLQIAGDLLPDSTHDSFVRYAGLGFIGLGAEYYKNTAKDQAEADELDDRLDTITRGFLGLTVACARCHDHKFDPIPTYDYYALAGVLRGFQAADLPLVSQKEVEKYQEGQKKLKQSQDQFEDKLLDWRLEITRLAIPKIRDYLLAAWKIQNLKATQQKYDLNQIAKEQHLNPYLLNRWLHVLQVGKKQELMPLMKAWQEVKLSKPGDKSNNKSSTKEIDQQAKQATEIASKIQMQCQEVFKEIAGQEKELSAIMVPNRSKKYRAKLQFPYGGDSFATDKRYPDPSWHSRSEL